MMRRSKEVGFSLVELMIVVAIMAILAAIAIPSFLKFQTKAKESEARNNLAAIRTCLESYRAENDQYIPCAQNPLSPPVATTADWVTPAPNWDAIGFEPSGKVRFSYQVLVSPDGTSYNAYALGNLTGEDEIKFLVSDSNPKADKSEGWTDVTAPQ